MKKNMSKLFLLIAFGVTVVTFVSASAPFDPPGKPGTPMAADKWKTGCLLNYLAPATDGGSPITNYIIEYRERWGFRWYIKGTSRNLEYQVENMQEGSQAEFRVAAENKAGVGEPSDPSDMVTFKDRL